MSQISLTSQIKGMATGSVVYRKTAGTGSPEVQTLATLKTDLGLTGTNSGDQTTVSGNAGTATALATSRNFSIAGGGITAAAVGFTGAANVTLSASVDASHITLARMADVATATVFYRKTAGTGAPEVQTLATLKTDLGLTGTNSGDQATIVGITGTLAQFNTACTDADFLSVAAAASGYQPLDTQLTDLAGLAYATNALKVVRVNAGETGFELATAGGGSGTVTSVGWTGGIVSVATATTTPAFTIAGTSGGIPYFSSGSAWATSAALAANALVVGGGAGAAPATVTTGTGILTALAANVGSAGAPVTFNGALGTPSSGTVTNLTGTASININGTVGATTPTTGAFTTLAATGQRTFTGQTGLSAAIGPTIADYFSGTISLDASSTYKIECVAYFLKTTAGAVTFTWAFSSAPTMASSFYTATPITGFTTTTITGAQVTGEAHVQAATTMAHAASGSLTTAVYHSFCFIVTIRTNGATTIQLRSSGSVGTGTVTPQAGSYMVATKII